MSQGLKRVAFFSFLGFAALVVLILAVGGVLGFLTTNGVEVDTSRVTLWVVTGVAVLAMSGAMAVTVGWMRSIDEAAREAHKSAWFWGGCGGMGVGGVLVIIASSRQAAAFEIPAGLGLRSDPAALMALGAAALALLMVAGYTVAWAWWWWSRR